MKKSSRLISCRLSVVDDLELLMAEPDDASEALYAAIVQEIAHALGESATLVEAVPRMLASVCEPLGWDYGALWEVDRAGKTLRCVGTFNDASLRFDHFA